MLTFLETHYCNDKGNWRGLGLAHKYMYQQADTNCKEAERHKHIFHDEFNNRVWNKVRQFMSNIRSLDQADEQKAPDQTDDKMSGTQLDPQTSRRTNNQTDGQKQPSNTDISDAIMLGNNDYSDADKKPADLNRVWNKARQFISHCRYLDQADGQKTPDQTNDNMSDTQPDPQTSPWSNDQLMLRGIQAIPRFRCYNAWQQ